MITEKPRTCSVTTILGSTAFAALIAIITLAYMMITDRSEDKSNKRQIDNQATQIALQGLQLTQQAEANGLNAYLNNLFKEQATVAAKQATVESQLRTPVPEDNYGYNLTATALAYQSSVYEATRIAISERQNSIEATQTAVALATPTQPPTPPPSYTLLGEWIYKQARAPMPKPANIGEVIFAHGDINNSGKCHVKEFGPGEQVRGLGSGSFKLWLISGPPEYIQQIESQLQSGAAAHAGTSCPSLP